MLKLSLIMLNLPTLHYDTMADSYFAWRDADNDQLTSSACDAFPTVANCDLIIQSLQKFRLFNFGVGQNTALHASPTCQEFCLSHFCLPISFSFIFPNAFPHEMSFVMNSDLNLWFYTWTFRLDMTWPFVGLVGFKNNWAERSYRKGFLAGNRKEGNRLCVIKTIKGSLLYARNR